MADFQWGSGGRKITTPEQARKQRAVAEALLMQGTTPAANIGQGLADVTAALSGSMLNNEVLAAEEAGGLEASGLFQGLTSASPQSDIIAALNSPWASDTQSGVARALLGDQLTADAGGGYFGSTLPYQNADGSLGYYQLTKDSPPVLPDGARWLEPTSTVNTGTAQTVVGRNTGAPVAAIPIDNVGANQQQAVGTGLGNISVEVINAGRSARSNNAKLDILEQTLAAAPQGAQGALVQAAGAFGIPLEGLDDVQAAQAIINQLVPLQRLPGSGTMSDADLALFKQSLPSIINQPGGNKKIIGTLRAINDYVEKAGDIEMDLVTNQIDAAEADRRYKALANPLQNFNAATGPKPVPRPTSSGGIEIDGPGGVWSVEAQ